MTEQDSSFLQRRLSRRDFLTFSGGLGIGAVAAQRAMNLLQERDGDPYVAYNDYVFGYPSLSFERQQRLLGSVSRDTHPIRELTSDEEGWVGVFDAHPHDLYCMRVEGSRDPNISLPVFDLEIGDRHYIIPVVESAKSASTLAYLGEYEGETAFRIKQLPSPDSRDAAPFSLQLEVLTADGFMRDVVRNLPEQYIRTDNDDEEKITNDIPLATSLRLRENWSYVRMMEIWTMYKAEENDHVPRPLLEEVGRIWDYDAVMLRKMTGDGGTLEEAHQDQSHVIKVDRYHNPPYTLPWGERVRYQIHQPNNMVTTKIRSNYATSFVPDEMNGITFPQKIERDRAIQVLSVREYIREKQLDGDDPYVLWFIANELNGVDLIRPFI